MDDLYPYKLLESVDSTNNYLKHHPELWKQYSTIHALRQTGGRGRHGRTWYSGSSNLTFSFIYIPTATVNPSAITLFAGLALRRALAILTGVNIFVKWPNDIFYDNKKIAGILTEMATHNDLKVLIIGIGINLAVGELPVEIQNRAKSLFEIISDTVDFKVIIDAIIKEMKKYLPKYSFPIGENILNEYNKYCLLGNHWVTVVEKGGTIKKLFNVHGINQNGNLLVEDNQEIIAIQDAFEIC